MIVTSDVDAFPMTKQIVAPIAGLRDRSVWLYRYRFTQDSGGTFKMAFIGAKSRIWKKMLEYDYDPKIHSDIGQGLDKWIEKYAARFNASDAANLHKSNNYTWEFDQHITSRAILASGLCSLPADNKLWNTLSLNDYQPK